MNKRRLTTCVLAISLLSLFALQARTASAELQRTGWSIEALGVQFCVGAVERVDECDIHVPLAATAATTESDLRATEAEPSAAAPDWSVVPMRGFAVCVGDVPYLLSLVCDVEVGSMPLMLGSASMRGVEAALRSLERAKGGHDASK